MVKIQVIYSKTPGSKFDFDYYLNVHMPIVVDRVGSAMSSIVVDRGAEGPGPLLPGFWAICTFECASREAFEAAFFPHMKELEGDIPNYTDVTPQLLLSETVFRA